MGMDDAAVVEEIEDIARSAESFHERSVSEMDVKYMKQRSYSTHRSKRSEIERYRRG